MGLRFPDGKKTVGFDRITETDVPQIDESTSVVEDVHHGPRAQYEQLALDGHRRFRKAERDRLESSLRRLSLKARLDQRLGLAD